MCACCSSKSCLRPVFVNTRMPLHASMHLTACLSTRACVREMACTLLHGPCLSTRTQAHARKHPLCATSCVCQHNPLASVFVNTTIGFWTLNSVSWCCCVFILPVRKGGPCTCFSLRMHGHSTSPNIRQWMPLGYTARAQLHCLQYHDEHSAVLTARAQWRTRFL